MIILDYICKSNIFYKVIYNNDYNIFTMYKNINYVLVEENNYYKIIIDYIYYPIPILKKYLINWKDLWIKKSDYLNKYYNSIKGKYLILDESFPYYYSLLDLSIYYLNFYNNGDSIGYIQHNRIDSNYFNPVMLKIDVKERDFAEYLKYIFYNGSYKDVNLKKIILDSRRMCFSYELVVARLLFPNYYFDYFDEVVLSLRNSFDLLKIISLNHEYELYIINIVDIISKFYNIKRVSFFKKK